MVRDLSLTFPKEVRDSAEVTRSRRGVLTLTIHMVRPGRDSTEVTRSRDSPIHMGEVIEPKGEISIRVSKPSQFG